MQNKLFKSSYEIQPASDSMAPKLWIEHLLILGDYPNDTKSVLREIRFHRGLNIIHGSHTAGKTTLCRLIRYILGESTFGTKSAEFKLRQQTPNPWVFARVHVQGVAWGVGLPLDSNTKDRVGFCLPGIIDLKEVLEASEGVRQSLDKYHRSLETLTEGIPGRFLDLLAWLTRDQKTNFSKHLMWRLKDSQGNELGLKQEEKVNVVGITTGLLTHEMLDFRRSGVNDTKPIKDNIDHLERSKDRYQGELEREFGIEALSFEPDFFLHAISQNINARNLLIDEKMVGLEQNSRFKHDERQLVDARKEVDTLSAQIVEIRKAFEEEMFQNQEFTDVNASNVVGQEISNLQTCSVPLDQARREGCPFHKGVISLPTRVERTLEKKVAQWLEKSNKRLESLSQRLNQLENQLNDAKERKAEYLREFQTSRDSFKVTEQSLWEQRYRLRSLDSLKQKYEKTIGDLALKYEEFKEMESQNKYRTEQYELQGKESERRSERLDAIAEYLLNAVLNTEVQVKTRLTKKQVKFDVQTHSALRESAAYDTLKVLALDMAILVKSLVEDGKHPRFLIHDSPRTNDLSDDYYQRWFDFVLSLETLFSQDIGFQYIICTTTNPPQHLMADKQHVVLSMLGNTANERLYGLNLDELTAEDDLENSEE